MEAASGSFARLMRLDNPPTAVITSTDLLAIGALSGAADCGVRVPEDVSIAGFDDIPLARFVVPPLTTVKMPIQEMARIAVSKAISDIHASTPASARHLANLSLIPRGSTGPVPSP